MVVVVGSAKEWGVRSRSRRGEQGDRWEALFKLADLAALGYLQLLTETMGIRCNKLRLKGSEFVRELCGGSGEDLVFCEGVL
ncbi:hypothetical protein SARC_02114 [Sphaeroforma arctica JP610]|uniref:Uncharacterized protein n=1 Tax=Sphaeroforma arctica JP610 TaxID=667725 RepID=A0A0L0GBS8_9EUKA|nr:hypothetical protein SARC_02114 [Sphaeroforma arctica JP610]KNC85703.1 hypothetical protein SARC_02114 [Sphaeroforma arctica JP610]|eukprot:XP_014159605.1 hypothetical protein SARC_02114 [Sphaeroforma arctica JP610]